MDELKAYLKDGFSEETQKKTTRKIELSNVSRKLLGNDYEKSMTFWNNISSNAEEQLGNPDIIHAHYGLSALIALHC